MCAYNTTFTYCGWTIEAGGFGPMVSFTRSGYSASNPGEKYLASLARAIDTGKVYNAKDCLDVNVKSGTMPVPKKIGEWFRMIDRELNTNPFYSMENYVATVTASDHSI
tara:strand:- start:73 stop:399 length:327 start_codon:yes stop_codon:yes gene_type:complete